MPCMALVRSQLLLELLNLRIPDFELLFELLLPLLNLFGVPPLHALHRLSAKQASTCAAEIFAA